MSPISGESDFICGLVRNNELASTNQKPASLLGGLCDRVGCHWDPHGRYSAEV
jgi:hypothetical protein